ncbi:MAG: GNAT family N-acetyltransferase [Tissierellia bacterium]|nr:GNAT family N-acetyltransferase [Tissierellia bacterium]
MQIKKITKEDLLSIAHLASENFIDDAFYLHLSSDRNTRKTKLRDIFKKSIEICINHGIAYGIEDKGEYIAFVLAFNYNHLLNSYPHEYNHIFPSNEWDPIYKKYIGDSKEYLYLLAIGVSENYRRRGMATLLVKKIQDTYPQYNIFSDVSNPDSLALYKKLNFEILEENSQCVFIRYLSQQDSIDVNLSFIKLAVPSDIDTKKIFGKEIKGQSITLNNIQVVNDYNPFFIQSLNSETTANLIDINYEELLLYQRHINVLYYTELKWKEAGSDNYYLIYVNNNHKSRDLILGEDTKKTLSEKKYEWDFISDCFISIPIKYKDIALLKASCLDDNFFINRILDSLNHRTNFESGIPINNLNNTGFKDRIERIYLGSIKIQIYSENSIAFNGLEDNEKICEPVDVGLIVSIDKIANGGVLHIVSLSCGLLISQFLDSVVRNQISVITDGNVENLYSYLSNNFNIYKMGTAKSFLTIPRDRTSIPDEFLASLLFCETYYNAGEGLGKVVDKEIKELLSDECGYAQYDYASVYMYSNIVLQTSEFLRGTITERIITESITLFYIELLLFEESAINIANDEIIRFLSNLDNYSPSTVLDNINVIISDYSKTIDYWDVQMNYPSSKKSIDNIRSAFQIENLASIFKRNLEQLLMIYDTRSDIIDKRESSILTAIGAIFTVMSLMDLIVLKENRPALIIGTFVVGFIIILKNWIFKRAFKRRNR